MPKDAFAHVDAWIFDLDNTLYDHRCRLFDQIDMRMTDFISSALGLDADSANKLRGDYWREHGTTLRGLMREHDMPPEDFLQYVHDIDLSSVAKDPALGAAIEALPGRKIVYTNGSRGHGDRVIAQLGIAEVFDGVFGIEDSAYLPKPHRAAFEMVLKTTKIAPASAAMFEDTARNLEVPHELGMKTVWTPTDDAHASEGADGDHVHYVAEDLTAFLRQLT
ncbi:MAG: pyrimidine 5'-nucleotidase [Pseudomonadota bacterium]